MINDISIDIETFGSVLGSSIAQIGAVVRVPEMSLNPDKQLSTFFVVVNDPGGIFMPATIRWHKEQVGDSLGKQSDARSLDDALSLFRSWLRRYNAQEEGEARLWTHATFDIPQLDAAFHRSSLPRVPWHYRNCRDLRTLYDFAGGRPKLDPIGKTHNALDDAIYQLHEIEECLHRIQERT